MKTFSISDLKEEIRCQSCRFFMADLVSPNSHKFVFSIGHFNEFSGFIPEFSTRPISFSSKTCLVAMARAYGLIGCKF